MRIEQTKRLPIRFGRVGLQLLKPSVNKCIQTLYQRKVIKTSAPSQGQRREWMVSADLSSTALAHIKTSLSCAFCFCLSMLTFALLLPPSRPLSLFHLLPLTFLPSRFLIPDSILIRTALFLSLYPYSSKPKPTSLLTTHGQTHR